ncbi:YihY/virulence factor BrkB family protein [uncultured Pseudokineococcus sp.]|uniref:YihY/virulence factor BrkB family protein n=1 Tax=uncultured Pseudokineococcus sp. TaxID=1642928 RepID=UPI002631EC66|nr:YihY/virulence factor BrkB family protein [uncultured Pseudokineococcus sp.]
MSAVGEVLRGRGRAARRRLRSTPVLGTAVRVAAEAARLGMRQRVTGLAAEAAFFALLSLPPLVLGITGLAALVGSRLGADTTDELQQVLSTQLGPFLTSRVVDETIVPTVAAALEGPRFDLISIGFLLSLWSGSRALAVLLETVSIMYGTHGTRGLVRVRAISVGLYVLGLGAGAVALPLLLLGPSLIEDLLPAELEGLLAAYWPVVLLLSSLILALLYHVATPVKLAWRRALPGAVLALALWVLASWGLRALLGLTVGSGQGVVIYGPLTAPIVLILWFYLLALAVLLGAGVNAAVEHVRPERDEDGLTAGERAAEGT